jgi:hypothetical protein
MNTSKSSLTAQFQRTIYEDGDFAEDPELISAAKNPTIDDTIRSLRSLSFKEMQSKHLENLNPGESKIKKRISPEETIETASNTPSSKKRISVVTPEEFPFSSNGNIKKRQVSDIYKAII